MTQEKRKRYLRSSTMERDKFIINGCGTFGETRKYLDEVEAAYLYAELHQWLFTKNKEL